MIPSIETVEIMQLKSLRIGLVKVDEISGFVLKHHIGRKPTVVTGNQDGYFKFENVDLNLIKALEVEVGLANMKRTENPAFELELYLDSLSGILAGSSNDFVKRKSNSSWDHRGIMRLEVNRSIIPAGDHDIYIKMKYKGESKKEYEFLDLNFTK